MASMTPNPTPGPYLEGQDVRFAFSPDIVGVAFSTDGSPPSISKYIAYDTLTPPNPFIAVTEDGRGRVVYDGGFPKFYNDKITDAQNTFALLPGGFKYLYNAVKWVANQEKVAAGNNKILVIGDATPPENYSVKGTNPNGFYDAMLRFCRVVGFVPAFKDRADYGGILNPTLSELETYSLVLVLSSAFTLTDCITDQAVNDFVTYRENGNGIIVITDHGPVLNSIQEAMQPHVGFFTLGNEIVTRFGAYFSGDFNRTPVNVGFLRSTYGDHPLYNNLTNDEYISAGGSESKVVVTTANVFDPANMPPIRVDKKGINTIQILAVLADGSMISGRYVYIIQGDEFVFVRVTNPTTGLVETNQGKIYADPAGKAQAEMWVDGSTLGTVWGEILKNGKRIGELYYTSALGSKVYWYAGSLERTPIRNADAIVQAIKIPFTYSKALVGVRDEVAIRNNGFALPRLVADIKPKYPVAGLSGLVTKLHSNVKPTLPSNKRKQPISCAETSRVLEGVFSDKVQQFDDLTTKIYPTTALTTAAIAVTPVVPGVCFVDASTNKVYGYLNGAFRIIADLTAQDIFGAPRTLINPTTGLKFRLELNGSITQIP